MTDDVVFYTLLGALLIVISVSILMSVVVEEKSCPSATVAYGEKTPTFIAEGIASYYSNDGCIGCREDRIMANGEVFDENKYTVAINNLKFGTWARITNKETEKSTYARVTDTGGFEKLGRIVDMSKAVKEAIDCDDLCLVRVEVTE